MATLLAGCEILTILAEMATPPVEINYDWWNNLINVPVIEGTIKNNTTSEVWKTTIEIQTFNENHECICTMCFSVYQDIPAGNCIPFKEWISDSPKACDMKARVVLYD